VQRVRGDYPTIEVEEPALTKRDKEEEKRRKKNKRRRGSNSEEGGGGNSEDGGTNKSSEFAGTFLVIFSGINFERCLSKQELNSSETSCDNLG
jgi:hypothetical protein